jgi:hypothetical protein
MAATVTTAVADRMEPNLVMVVQVSSITSDETVSITHGGPAVVPTKVEIEWTTPPTALCCAQGYHVSASDSTTLCVVKFVAETGGDLSGAVAKVRMHFYGSAAGGLGL